MRIFLSWRSYRELWSNHVKILQKLPIVLIIFAQLSGPFTPISSMPEWVQDMTLLNPICYFVEVMRMVYLKGSSFADLSGHFIEYVCSLL